MGMGRGDVPLVLIKLLASARWPPTRRPPSIFPPAEVMVAGELAHSGRKIWKQGHHGQESGT